MPRGKQIEIKPRIVYGPKIAEELENFPLLIRIEFWERSYKSLWLL